MGNRATIIFTDEKEKSISPAVYLHWQGGANSIYAFIDELNRRGIRNDQDYECARFISMVGDFFDGSAIGGLSLGVVNGPKKINEANLSKVATDHGDNGFYIICRSFKDGKWNTRMRRFIEGRDSVRELTAEEVETEREGAIKDKTFVYMASAFLKIQGDKVIENY